MRHHPRRAAFALAVAVLASACENTNTPDPPTTGSLTVTVETTGALPDPDGYRLTRAGTDPVAVSVNGTTRADSLAPGSYTLTLDNASTYCAVEGGATQTATVVAGQTAAITFRVRCERNGIAYLTVINSVVGLNIVYPGRDTIRLATGVGGARIRFSPDGRRVLYSAIPAGASSSAVMSVDLDSLKVTQVTPAGAPSRAHPAWSPDGTRVVYGAGNNQLRVLRVGETAEGTLWQAPAGGTPAFAFMPVWSPDGTRIAFLRTEGTTRIAILNADGTGERTLIALNTMPYLQIDWSPDGGSIVVPDDRAAGRGIYRVDVATGQATAVATSSTVNYRNPTYLRDGRIGFSGLNADGSLAGLWTVNADGSGLTRITLPTFSGGASIAAWQ